MQHSVSQSKKAPKGAFLFFVKPRVDTIRDEYLVPLIKSIAQLKELKTAVQKNREARIDRFLAMEAQLKETVRRICASSPTTAQSECAAAWNQ